MKDTLYNVIIKGIMTICMVVCTCTLLYVGCETKKANTIRQQYNSYLEQYDTTSAYNKLIIYEKMRELEDSLKKN